MLSERNGKREERVAYKVKTEGRRNKGLVGNIAWTWINGQHATIKLT